MTEEKEYMEFVEAVLQEIRVKLKISKENIRFVKGEKTEGNRDRILIESFYEDGLKGVIGVEAAGLFLLYKRGNSLARLVEGIALDREQKCSKQTVDILKNIEDYGSLKDRLIVRAVNYEENKLQIEKGIYRRLGDIALVVYVILRESEYDFLSAKVQKRVLKSWEKREKEVFETAMINTHILYPPRIYDWLNCPKGKFGYEQGAFMNPMESVSLAKGVRGNCLTNVKQLNGATSLFYPGVAKRLADLLEEDFYVAFTSIHEAMIHGVSTVDPSMIQMSLENINENNLKEEILSNRVYCYTRQSNTIKLLEGALAEGGTS